MKCLIVDDSVVTRRILVTLLRGCGFDEVVEAANVAAALEQCDPSLDLLVTDPNLPGRPGIDLIHTLRANPLYVNLRILVVSARNGREDVVRASCAGANGYVVKPFKPDLLRDRVSEVMANAVDASASWR